MAPTTIEDIGKIYPDGTRAVGQVNLEISDGEFLVLVGPSGCGESTVVRMISGLDEITEGRLGIGGRVVNDGPSKDRAIAIMFQKYALYLHMTVRDNMAFGLRLRETEAFLMDEALSKFDAKLRVGCVHSSGRCTSVPTRPRSM